MDATYPLAAPDAPTDGIGLPRQPLLDSRPRDGSRMASELEQDGKITWKGHGAKGTLRAGDELFALVEDEKMGDARQEWANHRPRLKG